jgi:hypothetical protein
MALHCAVSEFSFEKVSKIAHSFHRAAVKAKANVVRAICCQRKCAVNCIQLPSFFAQMQ